MSTPLPNLKYTSADLEALAGDGKRYEIIDGELYVSTQPSAEHQYVCSRVVQFLNQWNDATATGIAFIAPGLIFADDKDVAPDVVWMTVERFRTGCDQAGHFRTAPELVVEVLSPGPVNVRRDVDTKLKLYSRQGVSEYWIADPKTRRIGVYENKEGSLDLVATLLPNDMLTSPLLPGFSCPVSALFLPV